MSQANEFLKEIASSWKENDRLDVQLLMAICQLSIDKPAQADEGFSPAEVVEAVSKIKGRMWSNLNEPRQVSEDVRRNWNKLTKETWGIKQEGISQHLQDNNLNLFPKLVKQEGGGSGRVSKYRIEWNELEYLNLQKKNLITHQQTTQQSNSIRYVCEDIEDAGFLARIFKNGYKFTGWRRHFFLTTVVFPLILIWFVSVAYLFKFTIETTIGTKEVITTLISFVFMYWVVWTTTGQFYSLADNKIVVAPWWMQSHTSDRMLERRYPPLYPESSINAVRYTSKCPICDGIISVKSGGLEFRNRLIGYCEHSPREHVYSFDHITRKGKYVR